MVVWLTFNPEQRRYSADANRPISDAMLGRTADAPHCLRICNWNFETLELWIWMAQTFGSHVRTRNANSCCSRQEQPSRDG